MPTPHEVSVFISLLKHFGIFQPEPLYKIICPFHADKNASLQINIEKAFFYCYAECGAKGSSLELFKNFYKIQHPDKRIPSDLYCLQCISKIHKKREEEEEGDIGGEGVGGSIRIATVNPYSSVKTKINYKDGITEAKNYYYNLPVPCWYRASNTPEIEEEIRECLHYITKRGFNKKLLQKAEAKPSLNKYYPIIFPLLENGIFRGYVMRTFDPEVEGQRKYMYNKGFSRKITLAGTFKQPIVLIVEGYLDCLAAKQLGIQNVVAILGWKISSEQVTKLKKKGIKKIICGTDNDEAGNKGYKYFQRIGKTHGFEIARIRYPKKIKDFGDLLNNPKEAQAVLNQCKKLGLK